MYTSSSATLTAAEFSVSCLHMPIVLLADGILLTNLFVKLIKFLVMPKDLNEVPLHNVNLAVFLLDRQHQLSNRETFPEWV